MASLSRKGGLGRPRPQMNVTPLVDVVLVLLIIFMIVIPALEEGLNLEVPSISNVDEQRAGEEQLEPFLLSVTSDGSLYLDERRLPLEGYEEHLRAAHRREPARRLVLRGDREARYAAVRSVFANVQRVGFPGVSLRVNRRDDGQE
ncbi:Biopolymer transport protein ExbD [uncultured bacterium]|nr:biopolymer transporter ExbD [Sandaracinaceae bacterium]CAG1773218.1 Biopolymer transport protein ExbD [uncultured bacterium]